MNFTQNNRPLRIMNGFAIFFRYLQIGAVSILAILFPGDSHAQIDPDTALTKLINKFNPEGIYLSRNKDYYLAGETILIKGFIFSGYLLSDVSSNLYIELLDKDKNCVARHISPIYRGVSETGLVLPDTLPSSEYYLRAYTKWMLNFDEKFQYLQPVLVYAPGATIEFVPDTSQWSFTATPEGGHLLAGIPANIGIRFYHVEQSPVNMKGTLWDMTQNKVVDTFTPFDRNIAMSSVTPVAGHTYELKITDGLGNTKSQSLGQPRRTGTVLNLLQTDTTLTYRIRSVDTTRNRLFTVAGIVDNTLVYKASIKKPGTFFSRSFSTKEIPAGVVRLVLLDEAGSIVSERRCFLHPRASRAPIIPSISMVRKDLGQGSQTELSIKMDSSSICFAAAVSDDENPRYPGSDIISAFWLGAGFSKDIKNAYQYLVEPTVIQKRALDGIMIARNWGSVEQQKFLSGNNLGSAYRADSYLSYTGKATYKNIHFSNQKMSLMIFYPDSTNQVVQVNTDSVGQFVLEGLVFEGEATVKYYPLNRKIDRRHLNITLFLTDGFRPYSSTLPPNHFIIAKASANLKSNLSESISLLKSERQVRNRVKQLEEVVVKSKARSATQELDERLSSGRFYSSRETIFDFVNEYRLSGSQTVSQWVIGRVPGNPNTAAYFVNEYPVPKSTLHDIQLSDVAMIKVQGKLASHTVFIYLKTGREMTIFNKHISDANTISIPGYEKIDFALDMNSIDKDVDRAKADSRRTLLWSELLFAEKDEEVKSFILFKGDNSKGIRVSVIGLSGDGEPFYWKQTL